MRTAAWLLDKAAAYAPFREFSLKSGDHRCEISNQCEYLFANMMKQQRNLYDLLGSYFSKKYIYGGFEQNRIIVTMFYNYFARR